MHRGPGREKARHAISKFRRVVTMTLAVDNRTRSNTTADCERSKIIKGGKLMRQIWEWQLQALRSDGFIPRVPSTTTGLRGTTSRKKYVTGIHNIPRGLQTASQPRAFVRRNRNWVYV